MVCASFYMNYIVLYQAFVWIVWNHSRTLSVSRLKLPDGAAPCCTPKMHLMGVDIQWNMDQTHAAAVTENTHTFSAILTQPEIPLDVCALHSECHSGMQRNHFGTQTQHLPTRCAMQNNNCFTLIILFSWPWEAKIIADSEIWLTAQSHCESNFIWKKNCTMIKIRPGVRKPSCVCPFILSGMYGAEKPNTNNIHDWRKCSESLSDSWKMLCHLGNDL